MLCGDDGCPPFEGVLGSAPVPGSTEVLNKTTRRMEPCNPQRCPLATKKETLNGPMLVNSAPVSTGRAGAGGRRTDPENKQYGFGSSRSRSVSISSKTTGPDPVFDLLAQFSTAQEFSIYALDTYAAPAFPDRREALGAYLVNSTRMTSEEWQMYEDALSDSLDFENVAIQVNADCGRLLGG